MRQITAHKIDYSLIGPCLCITATSYGLCRYAYGLFIPIFREAFNLSDEMLAYIASISYGSYFLIALLGIYISSKMDPRNSLLLGGLCAIIGMLIIATANSGITLAIGVAIAGVTPGLAYTPISEIIVLFVTQNRQRNIYSIINSGTSLGVMLSSPIAILFENAWRWSWVGFSCFALLSTLWCAWVIPKTPKAKINKTSITSPVSFKTILTLQKLRVFIVALIIGIATSVYWTFSVDLITTSSGETIMLIGHRLDASLIAQLFWMIVGLAGFAGMFAGSAVNRLGIRSALTFFQIGIAIATALLASIDHIAAIVISGIIFGAFFVFVAATLGMWSLEVFKEAPAIGFGFTFLLLSAGQFIGPALTGAFISSIGLQGIFYMSAAAAISIVFLLPGIQLTPVASDKSMRSSN